MSKKRKQTKTNYLRAVREPDQNHPQGNCLLISRSSIPTKWLAALLGAGLCLRLLYLGRAGLWQDEMLLVMTSALSESVFFVFRKFWNELIVSFAWLPLPSMLMNVWSSLASTYIDDISQSPLWLRFPGAVLGAIGVWGTYLFSRRLFNSWITFATTLLMAGTLYPVFYSRELHAYPLLLCLSPFVLNSYVRCLFYPSPLLKDYIGLFGLSFLLVYAHLTAPMLGGALLLVSGVTWVIRLKASTNRSAVKQALRTTFVMSLTMLAILPAFIKILLGPNPHLAQENTITFHFMIHDFVVKLFLGDHTIVAIAAWMIFVSGVVGLYCEKNNRTEIRSVMAVFIIATVLILLAASRSQYLSPRYFAVLSPFMMITYAVGFYYTGSTIGQYVLRRPTLARPIADSLLAAIMLIHMTVFLPPMYQLKNKSVDFASIADWLNDNLAPGTPYVMESAYELRYVSRYYPTPGLIPAAPYVHGSRPGDLSILHERQISFIEQFPQSVFVQSVHHNYDKPEGLWSFPEKYFRQKAEIRDNALRKLVLMGIYPTHFRSDFNEYSFTTQFYYDSSDDIRKKALERGSVALISFPGWQVAEVSQFTYMWVLPDTRGSLEVENLTEEPVKGRMIIEAALQSSQTGPHQTTLRWGNKTIGSYDMPSRMLQTLQTDEFILPTGKTIAVWSIYGKHKNAVQAMLIRQAHFERSAIIDEEIAP